MTALARAQATAAHTLAPRQPTVVELRQVVIAAYKAQGNKTLPTLVRAEHVTLQVLQAMTTQRTILQTAVDALNAAGVSTENKIGAVMGHLGIDQDQLHYAVCDCFNGKSMSGETAAVRFGSIN